VGKKSNLVSKVVVYVKRQGGVLKFCPYRLLAADRYGRRLEQEPMRQASGRFRHEGGY
jgi:hypothetical protein